MRKRAFTLLLTIAMLFSSLSSTYVYASEGGIKTKRSYSEFTITIVSYTPRFGEPDSSGGSIFGHAFILFYNYSSIPVTVGHMLVLPGDYVSVGIFDKKSAPNEKNAGVWYNAEAYAITRVKEKDYVAASYDLTERQIATLSNYINSNSSYSYANYTCASFAIGCWNTIVPSRYQLSTTTLPDILMHEIQDLSLPDAPLPPTDKPKSTIAYQTPTGVAYDSGTLSILNLPF